MIDYSRKSLDCVDYSTIDELADEPSKEELLYQKGLKFAGQLKKEGIGFLVAFTHPA